MGFHFVLNVLLDSTDFKGTIYQAHRVIIIITIIVVVVAKF